VVCRLSKKIEKGENKVAVLTQKDFQREIKHVGKMFDYFFKIFKFLTEHSGDFFTEHDYMKWSIMLLFLRNFRIFRCAYRAMLNGYYEVAIAMLRMAFENHLLMFFLLTREKEAENWWHGKKFAPRFLKSEVRKDWSYDTVYRNLSVLIHANFEVTKFFSNPKDRDLAVWITNYNPKRFVESLHPLLYFGVGTLMIMPMAFKDKLIFAYALTKEVQKLSSSTKRLLRNARKKYEKKEEMVK